MKIETEKDTMLDNVLGMQGIIAAILTILVMLAWSTLSTFVRVVAVIYVLYRVFRLVTHNISCPVCLFKLLISVLVALIAFGLTHPWMIVGVIALIWIEALKAPGKHL